MFFCISLCSFFCCVQFSVFNLPFRISEYVQIQIILDFGIFLLISPFLHFQNLLKKGGQALPTISSVLLLSSQLWVSYNYTPPIHAHTYEGKKLYFVIKMKVSNPLYILSSSQDKTGWTMKQVSKYCRKPGLKEPLEVHPSPSRHYEYLLMLESKNWFGPTCLCN